MVLVVYDDDEMMVFNRNRAQVFKSKYGPWAISCLHPQDIRRYHEVNKKEVTRVTSALPCLVIWKVETETSHKVLGLL